MNYYEFMFAFCNKRGIDIVDFEKTLSELLKRNGVYITPKQHYDESIADLTNSEHTAESIADSTSLLSGAMDNEDYRRLKSYRRIVSDNFDKINTLMYRLKIFVDLFGVDTDNQKEIIYNIEMTVAELDAYCKEYANLIKSD